MKCHISDWCCIYHACMSDDCQKNEVLKHRTDLGIGNCLKQIKGGQIMSGWTVIEIGSVELEHMSTSSLIKITVRRTEHIQQGMEVPVKHELWLTYTEFSNLKKAISLTEEPFC